MNSFANWQAWQIGVVAAAREEFRELFSSIGLDDFDWSAWQALYEAGCSPLAAIRQAMSPYAHATNF